MVFQLLITMSTPSSCTNPSCAQPVVTVNRAGAFPSANSPIQLALMLSTRSLKCWRLTFRPLLKHNCQLWRICRIIGFTAVLTKLSQPQSTFGGKVKFTGSFAVIPARGRLCDSNGNFPGWINTPTSGLARLLSRTW